MTRLTNSSQTRSRTFRSDFAPYSPLFSCAIIYPYLCTYFCHLHLPMYCLADSSFTPTTPRHRAHAIRVTSCRHLALSYQKSTVCDYTRTRTSLSFCTVHTNDTLYNITRVLEPASNILRSHCGENGAVEHREWVTRRVTRHLSKDVVPVAADPRLHRGEPLLDGVVVGGVW